MFIHAMKIMLLSVVMSVPAITFYDNYDKIATTLNLPKNEIVEIKKVEEPKKTIITNLEKQLKEKKQEIKRQKISRLEKNIVLVSKNNNKTNNSKKYSRKKISKEDSKKVNKTNSINTQEQLIANDTGFTEEEVREAKTAVELMMEVTMDLDVDKDELDICFEGLDVKMCEKLITEVLTKNYVKD